MAILNTSSEITYRLDLTKGFLAEAEQDVQLKRWRSCVDNSQLAVENAGKAVLALFGVVPKTHEPARQVAALLRDQLLPDELQEILQHMLPNLLALGATEHFLTDYGDEANYRLPWDLFTEDSAQDALKAARQCLEQLQSLLEAIATKRQEESERIEATAPSAAEDNP